jgi:hypothetical protein
MYFPCEKQFQIFDQLDFQRILMVLIVCMQGLGVFSRILIICLGDSGVCMEGPSVCLQGFKRLCKGYRHL